MKLIPEISMWRCDNISDNAISKDGKIIVKCIKHFDTNNNPLYYQLKSGIMKLSEEIENTHYYTSDEINDLLDREMVEHNQKVKTLIRKTKINNILADLSNEL